MSRNRKNQALDVVARAFGPSWAFVEGTLYSSTFMVFVKATWFTPGLLPSRRKPGAARSGRMQFIRVTKQPPRLFYARRWMTADGDCFAALATTLSRDFQQPCAWGGY
jgi:hypothetical protein